MRLPGFDKRCYHASELRRLASLHSLRRTLSMLAMRASALDANPVELAGQLEAQLDGRLRAVCKSLGVGLRSGQARA